MLVLIILQLIILQPQNSHSMVQSSSEPLIFSLDFIPLEVDFSQDSYTWEQSYSQLSFQEETKFVLELDPMNSSGYLKTLVVNLTINGLITTKQFEDSDYCFTSPTQLAMWVNTSVQKIDHSVDISLEFSFDWSYTQASILIYTANFVSFERLPKTTMELMSVPLLSNWNSYDISSYIPRDFEYKSYSFLGNTTVNNRVNLHISLQLIGLESPWVQVFVDGNRVESDISTELWINETFKVASNRKLTLPLKVKIHPDRIYDRYKSFTLQLQVLASYSQSLDDRDLLREELINRLPQIPPEVGRILTLNLVGLPLLFFRKKRLEELAVDDSPEEIEEVIL